jgi:putative chitinase
MLNKEDLLEEFPRARVDIIEALVGGEEVLAEWGINTPMRMAHFLAQTGHESGGFRLIEENLNYSADGLNKIFPKYFIRAGRDATQYARKPEAIANVVYANRMGNGPTESGDGWRFRGRGLIQLTGRNNYTAFANACDMTIDEAVEYLTTPEGAIESAAWFWDENDISTLADRDDVVAVTKRINGGTIGLDDRKHHTDMFKEMFDI